MLINFLDMLCILAVIAVVVISYVIHLDCKAEEEKCSYVDAVIGDFKFISIGIVGLIVLIMVIRGLVVLFRMFC